jgi:hypothetical protein
LEPFSARLALSISHLKKPLWAVDFPSFLQSLVQEAEQRQVPDLSYFSPLEGEVSLSRFLFRVGSPLQVRLDSVVGQFPNVSPDLFNEMLLRECYSLLPEKKEMSASEESLILLLFYRCLFHRTYERFSSAFAPKVVKERANLEAIANLPAKWFVYPRIMVGVEEGERRIGEVFGSDRFLHAAGQFLEMSLWSGNPMDMIFAVHKAIVAIQKGAFINRLREDGDPMNEFLCFDDMFVLLFGTLLGMRPDIPDVEYIAWMIERFAPKDALSSAFEYAKTTIEGLAAHCVSFDIDQFIEEHEEVKE